MPRKVEIKEARRQQLTRCCLVCGSPARPHSHYGAVCCYSCRAFFRRNLEHKFVCSNKNELCEITEGTRTSCKFCRLKKCLSIGMRPDLVDTGSSQKLNSTEVDIDKKEPIETTEVPLQVSDAEAMSTEYFIFNPGSQSYVPFVPDASEDQFQEATADATCSSTSVGTTHETWTLKPTLNILPEKDPLGKGCVQYNQDDEGHRLVCEFLQMQRQMSYEDQSLIMDRGEPVKLIESSSEKSNSIIEEFKSAVMKNAKEQRLKEEEKCDFDICQLVDSVYEEERLRKVKEKKKPVVIVKPYSREGSLEESKDKKKVTLRRRNSSENSNRSTMISSSASLTSLSPRSTTQSLLSSVTLPSSVPQRTATYPLNSSSVVSSFSPIASIQSSEPPTILPISLSQRSFEHNASPSRLHVVPISRLSAPPSPAVNNSSHSLVTDSSPVACSSNASISNIRTTPSRENVQLERSHENEASSNSMDFINHQREIIRQQELLIQHQRKQIEMQFSMLHASQAGHVAGRQSHDESLIVGRQDHVDSHSQHVAGRQSNDRSHIVNRQDPIDDHEQHIVDRQDHNDCHGNLNVDGQDDIDNLVQHTVVDSQDCGDSPGQHLADSPEELINCVPSTTKNRMSDHPLNDRKDQPFTGSSDQLFTDSKQQPIDDTNFQNQGDNSSLKDIKDHIEQNTVSQNLLQNQSSHSVNTEQSYQGRQIFHTENTNQEIESSSLLLNAIASPLSGNLPGDSELVAGSSTDIDLCRKRIHLQDNNEAETEKRLRLDTENCISDAMQIITDSSENAVMITSNSSSFFDLILASTPSCSGSQITEIDNDDPENCNNTSLVPVKKSYTRKKMNAPKFRKFKVPYLEFTIEEEFLITQLKEIRSLHYNHQIDHWVSKGYEKLIEDGAVIWLKMVTNQASNLKRYTNWFDQVKSIELDTVKNSPIGLIPDSFGKFPNTFMSSLLEHSMENGMQLEFAVYFGNKNAPNLYEQDLSLKLMDVWEKNSDVMEKYCGKFREYPSIDLKDMNLFKSPWCSSYEDEQFYMNTIKELGEILNRYPKLVPMASIMSVLAQPKTSPYAKSKNLHRLFKSLATLMNRYMVTVNENASKGSEDNETLVNLIMKLPRCSDIFKSKRIDL